MAACVIAISSSASSFLTWSRIIRFAASARLAPLAAFRWADTVRFGLPLPIPSYSPPSAHRVPRSSRNRRNRPRVGRWGLHSAIPLTCVIGTRTVLLSLRSNRAQIQASGLSIYFNCGSKDDFGFNQGAAELHRQLQAEGIQHEYHLYPGNHGGEYFLAHLGEVLKFHARVFVAAK